MIFQNIIQMDLKEGLSILTWDFLYDIRVMSLVISWWKY